MINTRIQIKEIAIWDLDAAIKNGNVSQRETTLEEDLNNIIKQQRALEDYLKQLTASE